MSASLSGTVVLAGSGGQIFDSNGDRWTISPQLMVLVDGKRPAFSSNVAKIAYVNNTIWHQNTTGQWYSWNGLNWVAGSNPLPDTTASQILAILQTILPTLATKQEIQVMSSSIATELGQIQSAIGTVQASVSGISTNVGAVVADVATIATEIANLKGAAGDSLTTETQTILDNVAAAANSLQSNVSTLQTSAAAAQQQIDQLAQSGGAAAQPAPATGTGEPTA